MDINVISHRPVPSSDSLLQRDFEAVLEEELGLVDVSLAHAEGELLVSLIAEELK